MRDLLFRNLTSLDHKRRIISTSEVMEKKGVRSIIRRHFICIVKEIKDEYNIQKPVPQVHIIKEHNTREQRERFFCKIKGNLFAKKQGKLFFVVFMHSLKIDLLAVPQQVS